MRSAHKLTCSLLTALSCSIASAQLSQIRVIYVNGIQNTQDEAFASKNAVGAVLLESRHHSSAKRIFNVELKYNNIGFNGSVDADATFGSIGQDHDELKLFKTAEQIYIPDLAKLKSLHFMPPAPTDRIAAANVAKYATDLTPERHVDNLDATKPRDLYQEPYGTVDGDNSLELATGSSSVSDTDLATLAGVISNLATEMGKKTPLVIVAHSEGNLIANLAYAKAAKEMQDDDISKYVRIVNVANTSLLSINGLDLTHKDDIALYGVLGQFCLQSLPSNEFYYWKKPGIGWAKFDFTSVEPTVKSGDVIFFQNLTEHNLITTYLSESNVTLINPQGIGNVDDTLAFRDRFEDLVYAAAASIDQSLMAPVVSMFSRIETGGGAGPLTITATATARVGELTTDVHWEQLDHFELPIVPARAENNPLSGPLVNSTIVINPPNPNTDTLVKLICYAKDSRGVVGGSICNVLVTHTSAPNILPTVTAPSAVSVNAGSSITLIGTATDSDGTIKRSRWEYVSGPTVTLPAANTTAVGLNTASVTDSFSLAIPQNTAAGSVIELRYIATDNLDMESIATVKVTVTAPAANIRPSVNVNTLQPMQVSRNVPFGFYASATDPDGSIADSRLVQLFGTTVTAQAPNVHVTQTSHGVVDRFFFSGVNCSSEDNVVFQYTATDNSGAKTSDWPQFTVSIPSPALGWNVVKFDSFDGPSVNRTTWPVFDFTDAYAFSNGVLVLKHLSSSEKRMQTATCGRGSKFDARVKLGVGGAICLNDISSPATFRIERRNNPQGTGSEIGWTFSYRDSGGATRSFYLFTNIDPTLEHTYQIECNRNGRIRLMIDGVQYTEFDPWVAPYNMTFGFSTTMQSGDNQTCVNYAALSTQQ